MSRRTVLFALSLFAAALALSDGGAKVVAAAEPALVTIESRSPTLEEKEDDGWTTSLAFTNVTDGEIKLSVRATGCEPTLDESATLPARERTEVTVTIPATCKIGDEGFAFTVMATAADETAAGTFEVKAGPKPDDDLDWSPLAVFLIAPGVLLLVGLVFYPAWAPVEKPQGAKSHSGLRAPLPNLGPSWTFEESWVSSVTAAGALLTGVFVTSDLLKTLSESDAAGVLATVGVAIAAAFVAAGGVVVAATRSKEGSFVTIGGYIAGAALTIGGAIGQLWMVHQAARLLELEGWEAWISRAAWLGIALLALYVGRTVPAVIRQGAVKDDTTGRLRFMGHDEAVVAAASPATPRRAALL